LCYDFLPLEHVENTTKGLPLTSMVENLMKVRTLLQLLLALSARAVPQSLPTKTGTGVKSIFVLTLTKE
jgi:hypothetical protein